MKKWLLIGIMGGLIGTAHAVTTNPISSGTQMGSDVSSRVIDSSSVDTGVNNVPIEYSTDPGSRVIDNAKGSQGFCIINSTESFLAGHYTSAVSEVTPTGIQFYVPAAATDSFVAYCGDFHFPALAIFLKSDTGSAVSGGKIRTWTY